MRNNNKIKVVFATVIGLISTAFIVEANVSTTNVNSQSQQITRTKQQLKKKQQQPTVAQRRGKTYDNVA